MTADIARMPMQNRFQHLYAVISGQRFLNKQGLGNGKRSINHTLAGTTDYEILAGPAS